MPVCTLDNVAPEELVELVSCNCKGDCTKRWCKCKKNNVPCTDFCGCGDICQNTDAPPTDNCLNGEDDNEDDEESDCNDEDLQILDELFFEEQIEDDEAE